MRTPGMIMRGAVSFTDRARIICFINFAIYYCWRDYMNENAENLLKYVRAILCDVRSTWIWKESISKLSI